MKKKIRLYVCLAIIALTILDFVFPPAWWQFEAQKNKRAAIEYVKATYPEAKFKKGHYISTELFTTNNSGDRIDFEQYGIKFTIYVDDGKIVADSYWKVYAEHQLYNTYLKSFVESRGITADFMYTSSDLQKFYKNNPNANISQFDGSVGFLIVLYGNDESKNPESLGWLYDFYCYCRENITIPEYTVTIQCLGGNVTYSNKSEFNNEADFYNSFY